MLQISAVLKRILPAKKRVKRILSTFLLVAFSLTVYGQPGPPVQKPEVILKSYDNFFTYIKAHYKLNQDLIAYSDNLKPITKLALLQQLSTGNYLPVRLASNRKLTYQLYRMNKQSVKDMGPYVKSYSQVWLDNYKKEGRRFPKLTFTDINGKKYDATGKTLVVKCWFVGCPRCEKEMPELNRLLARYKNRKDIVFISLALDSKARLQAFLKRKRFNYPIIADQRDFIQNDLDVHLFPTHFVVNNKGVVVNVVSEPDEIEWALQHKI